MSEVEELYNLAGDRKLMYMIWHKKLGITKLYPIRLQAVIWCFLKGFVYWGKGRYWLSPEIEIKECK